MAPLIGVLLITYLSVEAARAQIREGENGGEFCLTESFQGSCSEDEVILMDTAMYGRMRLGRCVKTDFGFVGCSRDVLDLADMRCSGRRRCVIRVPDPLLEVRRPCNEEFKSYMEATYSCVKVVSAQPRLCQVSKHLKLTAPAGYIANVVTEETGCGSEEVPWVVEVQPGQRVNLTLYDFGRVAGHADPAATVGGGDGAISAGAAAAVGRSARGCLMYAYLRDESSRERVSVCGGGGDRRRHVYTSVTNRLEIRLVQSYPPEGKRYFMLHYEAVGCPDVIPPRGAWVQRNGDVILMGCKDGGESLSLTCNGFTWQGKRPNCTQDDPNSATTVFGVLSLPVGAAITLILAIAVGVSALILLAGLLFIRSRRRGRDKKVPGRRPPNPSILMADGTMRRAKDDPRSGPPGGTRVAVEKAPYSRQSLPSSGHPNDNEYAYVWETNPVGGGGGGRTCPHCTDGCNVARNVHEADCGHYGMPCPASSSSSAAPGALVAHVAEESLYEKSTYSRGGRLPAASSSAGASGTGTGGGNPPSTMAPSGPGIPQYFELDPDVFPKGSAPRDVTSVAAAGPGSGREKSDAERLNALRKFTGSDMNDMQRGDFDDVPRVNFMLQHGNS